MGKKYKTLTEKLDSEKLYPVDEALDFIVENPGAGFDEALDLSLSLGVDTKQSNQQVRGFVVLPHGRGKTVKVLVFSKGGQEKELKSAGADYVGDEDLIEKIKGGWLDFDTVISTPDMMARVSKVAKILGPKGLMPNPKLGTVTQDLVKAIKSEKMGKAPFRADKSGIIHASIGKLSFGVSGLKENFDVFFKAVLKARPASQKGHYLKKLVLSSTMGPGLMIDLKSLV